MGVEVSIAPPAGVDVGATSGVVAAATATAAIPAVAGRLAYLDGFEFTFGGATAGSEVTATITGLAAGTKSYVITVPTGAAGLGGSLVVRFPRPLAASGVNTAITFSCPTLGAGNTAACANIDGHYV